MGDLKLQITKYELRGMNKFQLKYGSFAVIFILLYAGVIKAQTSSRQNIAIVVTELLQQLPARQLQTYNQLMRELIDTGTEGVIILADMMNASVNGENAAVDYALSGMANFASVDVNLKGNVERAFIAVLEIIKKTETKAFIISQLAKVGSDESINQLSGYLRDEKLCSYAADALVSIGGALAVQTLQMALMSRVVVSPNVQRQIIQALGEIQPTTAGSEDLLMTMINTDDITTKGIILKALSQTGSKKSLVVLGAVAASTEYNTELTDANGAYIRLIKRVYEQGDKKEALKAAQNMLKNTKKSRSSQIRIAALEVLFYVQTDILKTLKSALKDADKSYRNAALNFASGYADRALYTELLKSLPKSKTEEKIDVLYWIGKEAQQPEKRSVLKTVETSIEKTGIQTIIQLLNDSDNEVIMATVGTLGVIGDKPALAAIVDLLKSNDSRILSKVKKVLESFEDDISTALAKVVAKSSNEGKIIILELISRRKANAYFTLAYELTKNNAIDVKNAAYKALKDVVSEKDFVILCGMLETSEPSYIEPLQHAVAASIASLTPEKQTEMISRRMLQAGDDKSYLYYPIMPSMNE